MKIFVDKLPEDCGECPFGSVEFTAWNERIDRCKLLGVGGVVVGDARKDFYHARRYDCLLEELHNKGVQK